LVVQKAPPKNGEITLNNTSQETLLLASAYVPYQNSSFENVFEPDEALCKGTIFPELFLPMIGTEGFYER